MKRARLEAPRSDPVRILPLLGLWVWAVVAGSSPSLAQEPNLAFERISANQGLSQVTVTCILQDRLGWMWFGTQDGLNRWDGYQFTWFKTRHDDPHSLSDNYIRSLANGDDGAIWIGTSLGLNRFDPRTGRFRDYHHDPDNPESLGFGLVQAMVSDGAGGLWVGTLGGGLNHLDVKSGVFTHYRAAESGPSQHHPIHDEIRALLRDSRGHLWIGTTGGLSRLDPETKRFDHFQAAEATAGSATTSGQGTTTRLSHNRVMSLYEHDGFIWIGTDGGGLNRLDPQSGRIKHYRHLSQATGSLSDDRVHAITGDNWDVLWIGTYGGGLNRFDLASGTFTTYRYQSTDTFSLSHNDINALVRDRTGVLWVGTYGNGISRLYPYSEQFHAFKHGSPSPTPLSSNEVRAVLEDPDGTLWVGSRLGLDRISADRRSVRNFRHDPADAGSLGSDRVDALYRDPDGRLWVGTQASGLHHFEPETETFVRYPFEPETPGGLSHPYIRSIYPGRDGRFWIGTYGGGLNHFDPSTETFTHFRHDPNQPRSLPDNLVFPIREEPDGTLWVGTLGGLGRRRPGGVDFDIFLPDRNQPGSISHRRITCFFRDRKGQLWIGTQGGGINKVLEDDTSEIRFQSWTSVDGLDADAIGGILEDERGYLWMSTTRGVSRFDPESGTFFNFNRADGALDAGYFIDAYAMGGKNRIYFGGIFGLTVFSPGSVQTASPPPKTMITDFYLSSRPVPLRAEWDQSPLKKPIYETESLVLPHSRSNFSFRFTALDFGDPAKHRFAYRMEGLDDTWIETDAQNRFANYNKPPPGTYSFQVKSANREGEWEEPGVRIEIKLLPPPWRTWWAYSIYSLFLAGLAGAYTRFQANKLKRERQIAERERLVAKRLRQLDKLKDEFLANTSHELRTPLNGIIGLAESLIDGVTGQLPKTTTYNLHMIVSSGRRLASLVNDLLDFSQLRNATIELRKTPLDLANLADIVVNLSQPLISGKEVILESRIDPETLFVLADEDRVMQILHNLIGNAVKFTDRGSIRVFAEPEGDFVAVSVADTGIGITPIQQERIFESFEQADGSTGRHYGGTGLGLAVTRQLVELHGGTIRVNSTVGEGSIFTFTLPASEETAEASDKALSSVVADPSSEDQLELVVTEWARNSHRGSTFNILVVDDEPVNRQVLINHLSLESYHVVQASSGPEALRIMANDHAFDLILLDVMMPQMTGYEVCEVLRQRFTAQELPVLFLTAKNRINDLVRGFSAGGNDYITKPISKSELIARVETQLKLLESHRGLERQVAERTQELKLKNDQLRDTNQELRQKNSELETLDQIVCAINREVMLETLVESLLEKGFTLFPQAEKGALLLREDTGDLYKIAATYGYDPGDLESVVFSEEELWARYSSGEEKEDGVWLVRHAPQLPGWEKLTNLPKPQAMLSMSLVSEDVMVGVLILDNFTDSEAFDHMVDVGKLKRFRQHAISAVNKARYVRSLENTTRQLSQTRRELLEAAHKAGMAEIAIGVLHNIGNTLNSITTSTTLMQEYLAEPKPMRTLKRIADLMEDHRHDLIRFLAEAKKGDAVPPLIIQATKHMTDLLDQLNKEARRVSGGVAKINEYVQAQNEYTDAEDFIEEVDVNGIVEHVVSLQRDIVDQRRTSLKLQLSHLPLIMSRRNKISQIMTHLLFNAIDAIRHLEDVGQIRVQTAHDATHIQIEVRDNGAGIPKEEQATLFSQEQATKRGGRGFGLHYCALAAKELGGQLWVESEAGEIGTKFVFRLPRNNI
ncbi:Response regulator [Sulfidibacter corallicola]|uniref:histidine kinase n=1 Tax=Sulfidibacter corallicola TaxID=2818388 RepID=A0A8A4TMI0_SULCO|nr:two-component regulator propeller domain-containing protein [Sulfidibacter corallicola]QTD50312.1 response regulator [Sulfidibacter corallicola]